VVNSLVVRGLQGRGDGRAEPGRRPDVQRAVTFQQAGQRVPVDQLHHDPRVRLVLRHVVHHDHVRVPDQRRAPGLAQRTLAPDR
jgi:hypothetical protein